MKKEIFYANNICVSWRRGADLKGLTLSICSGEVLGLFGNRYAGKGALFHTLTGQIAIHSGMILWNGSAENPRPPVAMIGKYTAIIDDLQIWENIVLLGRKPWTRGCLNPAKLKSIIKMYLEDYGLTYDIDQKAGTLSQLEKLMIEAMMSLRNRVQLLVIDLNGMGGTAQEYGRLKAMLGRLCQEGMAVVISSHQAEVISLLSDRVAILYDGRILKEFTAGEIRPEMLEKLAQTLYHVEKRPPNKTAASRKCVFQISGLAAGLRESVSFSLYRGELAEIVSPQREMFQILCRRILEGEQKQSCQVLFGGRAISRLENGEGILFMDTRNLDVVIQDMTPLENLCLGISQKAGRRGLENKNISRCMEQDFYEWYGHEGLLRQKNCHSLAKEDRVAINLFRLRFMKADVIFCSALNVHNDVVLYRMVEDALIGLTQSGTSVCVLSSDIAYRDKMIERRVVLDGVSAGLGE